MSSLDSPTGDRYRRALALVATIVVLVAAVVAAVRSCGDGAPARSGARMRAIVTKTMLRPDPVEPPRWDAPRYEARLSSSYVEVASPSVGWEYEADMIVTDLRRVLEGGASPGAFAEARAEAARQDLVLFPPDEDRIRRMLLGGEIDRTRALAALAARPPDADDVVSLVLRSQRPEDDDLLRLLGAEVCSGLAPEVLSRHEEDLLHAFEREPNPLVLAFALPALERMREERLRELMKAQVANADPEMLPILLALARDRLGSAAMESVEETLRGTVGAGRDADLP